MLEKIESGYYRCTYGGVIFFVMKQQDRRYHQNTGRITTVVYWTFKIGDVVSEGHGMRRLEAVFRMH